VQLVGDTKIRCEASEPLQVIVHGGQRATPGRIVLLKQQGHDLVCVRIALEPGRKVQREDVVDKTQPTNSLLKMAPELEVKGNEEMNTMVKFTQPQTYTMP